MMRSCDWRLEQLDSRIRGNDGKGLCNKAQALGRIANACLEQAEARAFAEYDKFNKTQRIESDFDRVLKEIETKKPESEE